MKVLVLISLAAIYLPVRGYPLAYVATDSAECVHYWKDGSRLVASGKPVGIDVGPSPFSGSGVYDCNINLSYSDLAEDRFLFIGEVGDSSYLELVSMNDKPIPNVIVTHGLSPDSSFLAKTLKPRFTSFVPFIVRISSVFRDEGNYRFKVHYLDISPAKAGIRSGPVTKVSLIGLILRLATSTPGISVHFFQLVFFFSIFVMALILSPSTSKAAAVTALATILSSASILQVSGAVRYFIDLKVALWLNFAIQNATFFVFFHGLSILVRDRSNSLERLKLPALTFGIVPLLVSCIVLPITTIRSQAIFGAPFLFFGVAALSISAVILLRRRAAFIDAQHPNYKRAAWLLILATGFLFDMTNWVVLDYRFPFFITHYIFFSSFVLLFFSVAINKKLRVIDFDNKLRGIRNVTIQRLASPTENSIDTLSWLAERIGDLVGCGRVSILEVSGDTFKFLGVHGRYKAIKGEQKVTKDSHLSRVLQEKTIQDGRGLVSFSNSEHTDWHVIPLNVDGALRGVLCLTDYRHGWLQPFYEDRLLAIQQEIEPCVSLLFSKREAALKGSLVDIERERLNPILILSEEYLLKNFLVSETQESYAFMMGDLVGSVTLRETFGNAAVDGAIHACLNHSWEVNRELGGVIDAREGDSFSITLPRLVTDTPTHGFSDRCLAWLRSWNGSDAALQSIARSHGISSEFTFRVVMAISTSAVPKRVVKRFDYDANPAKDAAARVLKDICLPGECIVLGADVAAKIEPEAVFSLEARRLRGKKFPVALFVLKKPEPSPKSQARSA